MESLYSGKVFFPSKTWDTEVILHAVGEFFDVPPSTLESVHTFAVQEAIRHPDGGSRLPPTSDTLARK